MIDVVQTCGILVDHMLKVCHVNIFSVCNVKYTRASYIGLLTVALSVRKRSHFETTVIISIKKDLSVLNVWRLFCFVLIADSVHRSLLNRLHENAHVFHLCRQKHAGS